MRRAITSICLFVFAAGAVQAHAQRFELVRDRQLVVELSGLWRFHPGDDPRWKEPGFDDSQWALLHSDQDWSSQGYKGLSGMAWYRFTVDVPANSPPLSIYVPSLLTSYEVYADGAPIGGFGGMPPNQDAEHALPQTLALPHSMAAAHTVTIAIRVWHWPLWATYRGGGPLRAASIGETSLIQKRAGDDVVNMAWSLVDNIVLSILQGLAGLAALGFFFLRPREREYLWFGLLMVCSAAMGCFIVWGQFHRIGKLVGDDLVALIGGMTSFAAIMFYHRFLQGRRDWLFWLAVAATIAYSLAPLADGQFLSVKQLEEINVVLLLPFSVWVLTLLLRALRAGQADARLLLLPVLLQQGAALTGDVLWLSYLAGWQHTHTSGGLELSSWPFYYNLGDLTDTLFLLAMVAILIWRFTRTRSHEERYAGEMEAARVIQQVLVPEPNTSIEGFQIEAEYLPAQEVGGDFYQIIPTVDGGLLVVNGDVSGKGMPAAMLVALLVGAIRTEAAHTSDPAMLLETLNRRVYGRMSSGFATCAALHISSDGSALLSNAANPAPYLNGEEIELPGALPLGMLAEVEYENYRFALQPGDTLTFVSDGVVEATKKETGELFGFERTRQSSRLPAGELAEVARSFGQSDDITVLNVTRLTDGIR